MTIINRLFWRGIFLIAALILSGCTDGSRITVIKLGHVLDTTHPVHMGMVYMAEKVAEKSGGRMRVDIYPGGQLEAEGNLIELLQISSLKMTKMSSACP